MDSESIAIIQLNMMIRNVLISILLLTAFSSYADPPDGYPFVSYDQGIKQAQQSNKMIFIYFGRYGDMLIILLGGGTKKRQQKDAEAAKALWKEYKRRKQQEN